MFKRKTEVIENKYFSLMGTVDPFQLEKKNLKISETVTHMG